MTPKPETRNPKPETETPKPETLQDSEREEASSKTLVKLSSGEEVAVITGSEDPGVSPSGLGYRVLWTTDEDGKLVVMDTYEDEVRHVTATAPPDTAGGEQARGERERTVNVEVDGSYYSVAVPAEVAPEAQFVAEVLNPKPETRNPKPETRNPSPFLAVFLTP